MGRLLTKFGRRAEWAIIPASPKLHRNQELQVEWNVQGEESFEFAVLEVLPEDTPSLNLRDRLNERRQFWAGRPMHEGKSQ